MSHENFYLVLEKNRFFFLPSIRHTKLIIKSDKIWSNKSDKSDTVKWIFKDFRNENSWKMLMFFTGVSHIVCFVFYTYLTLWIIIKITNFTSSHKFTETLFHIWRSMVKTQSLERYALNTHKIPSVGRLFIFFKKKVVIVYSIQSTVWVHILMNAITWW